MRSRKSSALGVSLVLLILGTAMPAQTLSSTGIGFAMVGVAAGQTARLNLVNFSDPSSTSTCNITMQFLDAQGKVLKTSTANLAPGSAGSLDLSQSELQSSSLRTEIRAAALFGYSGGANPPPQILQSTACSGIVPSLEIFDNASGITRVILVTYRQLPQPVLFPQ